ncbi:glutamate-ammonia-ligase adenylyltransferase [Allonocardiopsis opalescens]|uniref:Bifunctional glutamine synthetase adenylyltransferase/adenylyl-removing enzyme n=1 Tax=Allonocardiopsis opalescens TaxID=1144618 RepID=A0A2T0Q001_9ACTN|nr:glutamate-ammonia-ligase adenylyltransferase [Allonocardiopsis opalescens]
MTTAAGRLARLGFVAADQAAELFAEIGLRLPDDDGPGPDRAVVEALREAADPEAALTGLARLLERAPDREELLAAVRADAELRGRLLAVLGASTGLTDHLCRHPGDWRRLRGPEAERAPEAAEVRAELLRAVGADDSADPAEPPAARPDRIEADPVMALRAAYRRRVLGLAARDLTGLADVKRVAAELADLAAAALEAALAVARAELGDPARWCRLAVIGMGKCGARELNYVSDVDVVFVAEPAEGADDEQAALRAAERLAAAAMRVCMQAGEEAALWQVDAALRPEGRNGPLVRTLASHTAYYRRWAQTWEFQALLKARPVAGDAELGAAYLAALAPMVWRAAERENFVADVQAMRRRVEASIPAGAADRQLKLGPGGLRDVEFAVQLLQLVHGRTDESLRAPGTLDALDALSAGGYVGRDDAADLSAAYRFLRRVEHLLQLHRMRRTHMVPDGGTPDGRRELRRIGRALGHRTHPEDSFTAEWRRHAREVRRLHEKLFYRPLLQAAARVPSDQAGLSPEAAEARLSALGFGDPAGALRHIQALTTGVSRRAAIQRTLLPVMLGWFAAAPDADGGLLGFRQVSDALGSTPWYLRLLRDEAGVAERMAWLLGSGRYATDLLLRAPDAVAILGDDAALAPRPQQALAVEADAVLRRHATAEFAVTGLRALRRRELFRVAAADIFGLIDVDQVGEALSAITAVTLDGALRLATRAVLDGRPSPTRFTIVAMGRFGGRELGYASDADVMFVHDPLPGADEGEAARTAHAIAVELRRLLALPAPDPALHVDADLRPEGRQGPLVRTLASYRAYYRRWSSPWESQALLRAAVAAGDAGLGARFTELIEPLRHPEHGIDDAALREIRRLKARMESERLPRGADPGLHTKLGRGGLSDVEWVAQLLQLQHAHRVPALRGTRTLEALAAAVNAGLLDGGDARRLAAAWRLAGRIRGAITLVRGKGGDSIPTDIREGTVLARVLGYDSHGALIEDYRRTARRARAVMERVFYG